MLRVIEYFLSMSLNEVIENQIVPFESLGTVYCLHSVVTMALSCIISEIFRSCMHSKPALEGSLR